MTRTYAHMCRDDHQEIGHNDSEHEQCPLCRAHGEIVAAWEKLESFGFPPPGIPEFGDLPKAIEAALDGLIHQRKQEGRV